ncbi:cyclic nucleotide-binding domain-containing protein [Muricauda sp. JGD-17]|uniref:Cyclic nucleotide-binding domain-containing protein n=1 Tax=Flagellimonas ochracea TaxID=2696472 RepID=A0A964TBE7_9FLAO|nr:Crp/Fnr family transcriptional regulator [Allomuricauda ochracea]NAY90451.1 cyclic nucleotide-binding domain-containing protein [Allomuricauda ochracea]
MSLEDSEFEYFCSLLEENTFKKKEYLLQSGQLCNHHYFIIECLVRTFYFDDSGTEKIVQFGIENWWVTNMDSFIKQKPSSVNIQALEPTTTLSIRKDILDSTYDKLPKIERLFRIITENWLIAQQRNSHFYMKASSKDRYFGLIKSIPNFTQRVPQYMIASYLDITPEYLSELRKTH